MKKFVTTVMLALAVWGGASAQSLDRELGALASARRNLANIATALEMYSQDHDGQFPATLEPLQVNYLKAIPPQLNGSKTWNYRVDANGFRLAESWEGFTRLGLPAQVNYDSRTGLDALQLADNLKVLNPSMALEGEWLRKSHSPGLTASWENFDRKISARLLGPNQLDESFEQQKQRIGTDFIGWGWKADEGDFARAVPKALRSGWNLEGIYTVPSQPGMKAIVVSRGERVIEVMVQDRDSRDALGSYRPLKQILAQL
ncbi:MAG: hypothetical protein J0I12_30160 [Candidatus Eremiobacteraeota bacterium]|nr:hypothetical protein [Candidatus Eremiobacteraeota bacterium]